MSTDQDMLMDQVCVHCQFTFPVAKSDVTAKVKCPRCGKTNLVGEGHPEAEEAPQDAQGGLPPPPQHSGVHS